MAGARGCGALGARVGAGAGSPAAYPPLDACRALSGQMALDTGETGFSTRDAVDNLNQRTGDTLARGEGTLGGGTEAGAGERGEKQRRGGGDPPSPPQPRAADGAQAAQKPCCLRDLPKQQLPPLPYQALPLFGILFTTRPIFWTYGLLSQSTRMFAPEGETFLFYKDLSIHERHTQREAEIRAEAEAGPRQGARWGTRS